MEPELSQVSSRAMLQLMLQQELQQLILEVSKVSSRGDSKRGMGYIWDVDASI